MIFIAIFLATFIMGIISINSSSEKDVMKQYEETRQNNCRPHKWEYKNGKGMECGDCGFRPKF